jgi:hypothetical protein
MGFTNMRDDTGFKCQTHERKVRCELVLDCGYVLPTIVGLSDMEDLDTVYMAIFLLANSAKQKCNSPGTHSCC